jgi:hypothetical protein
MHTLAELKKCAERELRLRKRVYSNRLLTGRMSEQQATNEIQMMEEIAQVLENLAKDERLL